MASERESFVCTLAKNSRVGESDRECARVFLITTTHRRRHSIGIALSMWHVWLSVWVCVCANCAKFPPDSSVEREGEKTQHLRGEEAGENCRVRFCLFYTFLLVLVSSSSADTAAAVRRGHSQIETYWGRSRNGNLFKMRLYRGYVSVCVWRRRRRRLRVGTRVAPSSARFALLSALFA